MKQFFSLGRGEYGWGRVIVSRPIYGLARIALAVVLPDAPIEKGANLCDHTINGGSLPFSVMKPSLQLA